MHHYTQRIIHNISHITPCNQQRRDILGLKYRYTQRQYTLYNRYIQINIQIYLYLYLLYTYISLHSAPFSIDATRQNIIYQRLNTIRPCLTPDFYPRFSVFYTPICAFYPDISAFYGPVFAFWVYIFSRLVSYPPKYRLMSIFGKFFT